MRKVLVLFPPKTKNSSKLYFRAGQIVESLEKLNDVTVIGGVSETGTTRDRKPLFVRVWRFLGKLPTLFQEMTKTDLVLIFPSPFWYGLIPLARLMRKPIVLDHFTTYLSHADYIQVPIFNQILVGLDKMLYPKLNGVVTHTTTMQRDLNKYYSYPIKRIFVLYSVVDTGLFDPKAVTLAQRTKLRHDLGIPVDSPVVMYHGAAHPFHGLEVIKEAANHLESASVSVLLVGDPEPKDRGPANIFYQEYVPFEKLPIYLALADIWLGRFMGTNPQHPRGDRAASSCMFQAMAMQLPVITAEGQENNFVLENGEDGMLIPPNDPVLLAKKVLQLLKNPNRQQELGKNARQRIKADFSLLQVDQVIGDLVESVSPASAKID